MGWKRSSLRKWLNDDFLNTAFDEQEKEMLDIVEMEKGYPDCVFLLCKEEIMDPDLLDDDARLCDNKYWLRSVTGYGDKADIVAMYGWLEWAYLDKEGVGVRPAIWVDLNE